MYTEANQQPNLDRASLITNPSTEMALWPRSMLHGKSLHEMALSNGTDSVLLATTTRYTYYCKMDS